MTASIERLSEELSRWVAAGLLSEAQASAILAHDRATFAPSAVVPPPTVAPRRISVVAEALGYLGGALAVAGMALLVGRSWFDFATVARLVLSATGALALLGIGALVAEQVDPSLTRLRGILWVGSSACSALFAGVLAANGFGVDQRESIVLACAAMAAVESGVLWRGRDRPFQQFMLLTSTIVAVAAAFAGFADAGPVGLSVWVVGAAYLLFGIRHRLPAPLLTIVVGAVAVIVGPGITTNTWIAAGLGLGFASAFGLLALAGLPSIASTRSERITLTVIGSVALVQSTPSNLIYFARDAGAATGLATWALGCGVMIFGARRLVRFPVGAEVLGAVTMVGGGALIGIQWHGFAPIFGIATAIGLLARGMAPGHVLMSVVGSVGLLVNVPWAIGWFFPGEGRAALLVLVSGILILCVAVLLTRLGGRFRHELGGAAPEIEANGHGPRARDPSPRSPRARLQG